MNIIYPWQPVSGNHHQHRHIDQIDQWIIKHSINFNTWVGWGGGGEWGRNKLKTSNLDAKQLIAQ